MGSRPSWIKASDFCAFQVKAVSSREECSTPPRPVRWRCCNMAKLPITTHMPVPWSTTEAPKRMGGSLGPPLVLDKPLKACSRGS